MIALHDGPGSAGVKVRAEPGQGVSGARCVSKTELERVEEADREFVPDNGTTVSLFRVASEVYLPVESICLESSVKVAWRVAGSSEQACSAS
jgi:hypothetical protein